MRMMFKLQDRSHWKALLAQLLVTKYCLIPQAPRCHDSSGNSANGPPRSTGTQPAVRGPDPAEEPAVPDATQGGSEGPATVGAGPAWCSRDRHRPSADPSDLR